MHPSDNDLRALLAEAQALLDVHGQLPRADALLEGELVVAIVTAEPSTVLTVRGVKAAHALADVPVRLTADGADHRLRLDRRGQVGLPGQGPWRVRIDPNQADLVAISRRLPAAASTEDRRITSTLHNEGGDIETLIEETPESHLVVEVTAPGGPGAGVPLVHLNWSTTRHGHRSPVAALVTPLTATGSGLSVRYDLGSIDGVENIEMSPADWTDVAELTPALVRETLRLGQFGTARRAWVELSLLPGLADDVRAAVEDALKS